MNRGISPEDLYSKLVELEDNDDEKAISLVQEFIKGTKKRSWSKAMNELMVKAIEIIISQSQIKPLKEVIAFCRSLTQVNFITQFEGIVQCAKEFLFEKYEISNDKFKKFKDKQNLDIEEDTEIINDNLPNAKDILEEEANCTIVNINDSNYNLNCLGEKNILYNLQSAVSFFNNDTLLINFDENTTSKIIFNTSRVRKKDTNGLSAGAILVMILVIVFILAINFKLYYF